MAWQPQGQRDNYAHIHKLAVQVLDQLFSDWQARLHADPDVVGIDVNRDTTGLVGCSATGGYRCGSIDPSTPPPPGAPITLAKDQAFTFAHVAFAPGKGYGAALAAMVDLGLVLADYCAAQAPYSPTSCPKTPPSYGQEALFASTNSLTVATWGQISSDHWRQQLQATAGVVGVQTPYAPYCPNFSNSSNSPTPSQ